MHEQLLSFAGRVRRRRLPRRLVSVLLGVALAGGMLAAAPAQAARGGSLVQIVSPADGADIQASSVPVTIQLRPGARPPTLQVLLDSRDVTARFRRHGHTVQGVLTSQDGLAGGSNVLTARVTGPGGARSAAQVTFRVQGLGGDDGKAQVPPTFPLQTRVVTQSPPGPGDNFKVVVGAVARLAPPLTASTASCGNGVWVLALHRSGDHRLDQDSSVDEPLCTTADATALGSYLAGLPAGDMVIVNSLSHADPPKPVPGLGEALAKIGAVAAEFDGLGAGFSYSVWGIPGLPAGQAYQVGDTWADEQTVPAGNATAASINATLVQDNNQNYTLDMRDYVTFSLGGADPQESLQSQGNITVGDHTYPPDKNVLVRLEVSQDGGRHVVGGFHVLILDRRTLTPLFDATYATDTDGYFTRDTDASQQAQMANDLDGVAGAAQKFGESALVLVASLGNPMAEGQLNVEAPTIAQALAPFGGTPDVINSGTDHAIFGYWPYALVGALSPPASYGLRPVDAPEASPAINKGATGELDGVLQRGTRGMWYGPAGWNAPYLFDINNGPPQVTTQNYGLYQAIAQAPTPWPVPAPGPGYAGELAAYHYLSQVAMCPSSPASCPSDDIRSYYYSAETTLGDWQADINKASYSQVPEAQKQQFTQQQFDAVQSQLGCDVDDTPQCPRYGELTDVLKVDALRNDMHTLLTDSNSLAQQQLTTASNNVSAVIPPPSSSEVGSALYDILEIVQALVDVGGAVALAHPPGEKPPEPQESGISEAVGLAAAILEAANDLNDDKSGALQDQLQTTVSNLGQQTSTYFAASLTGLDETFGEITSDWGRLSAVADGLHYHSNSWDVSGNEGQIATAMSNAMEIGYYKALIPVVYAADEGFTKSPDPAKWCVIVADHYFCPFGVYKTGGTPYKLGTSAYSYPVNNPKNNWSPAYDLTVVGQRPVTDNNGHGGDQFPADLMTDLTKAGYYPGWFFQRFPFYRSVCAPSQKFQQPDNCKPSPY